MAAEPDLAALHARAAREAERFHGQSEPPAWLPKRSWWLPGGGRRGWLVGGLLTLIVATGGLWFSSSDVPAGHPPPAPVALAVQAPPALPRPNPATVDVVSAPAVPLHVAHENGLWQIEADRASRLVAAQQLAALNGWPLQGDLEALAASRPLSLHWQGTEVAFAWRAVLADTVAYQLQCDHGRCQAVILRATPVADAADDEPPGNQPPGERTEPTNPGVAFH